MKAASGDRILAILDLFSEDRLEWRPDQMMAQLGYSRPTLYRYLRTLCDAGLLTSLPGAAFTLGPRVTELDFLMRRSDPLIAHGAETLDGLAQRHPCSALLVRWYRRKLLCIAASVSAAEPRSSYPRGRPMPLGHGAISRAILAWMPKRSAASLIEEHLDEFARHGVGNSLEDVFEVLRKVRRDGFAVGRGEVTPGVIGIAAPVFDSGRSPIAALTVTTEASLLTPEAEASTAEAVRDGARRLTETLARLRDGAGPVIRNTRSS